MPHISITSSLYQTEQFLPEWKQRLFTFNKQANKIGLDFEINAIANEPSEAELEILNDLAKESWFKLHIVPRESIYASWNRGVGLATAPVCTFWNVDDNRNPEAILDGLKLTETGADVVYFPFTYKRYLPILGYDVLVKKVVFTPPLFDPVQFSKEMHCGPFFLFTKDFYQKIGPFNESFRIAGDFDWCVRAAKEGNIMRSEIVAGVFEKRPGTLSGGRNPLQAEENARIMKK